MAGDDSGGCEPPAEGGEAPLSVGPADQTTVGEEPITGDDQSAPEASPDRAAGDDDGMAVAMGGQLEVVLGGETL